MVSKVSKSVIHRARSHGVPNAYRGVITVRAHGRPYRLPLRKLTLGHYHQA